MVQLAKSKTADTQESAVKQMNHLSNKRIHPLNSYPQDTMTQ